MRDLPGRYLRKATFWVGADDLANRLVNWGGGLCSATDGMRFLMVDIAELGFANPCCVLQDCIEISAPIHRDELLMMRNTFAVAVCCSNDSRNSFSNRVFSMAMTAWAAKFCTNSICLSVNGRTSWR